MKPVRFGRYVLLDRLGTGGMAEVFRATVSDAGGAERVIAVKRILDHLADDDAFVQMFISEAKLAAQLIHPNITQVYDLGRVDEVWFMALEFIEGRDLRAVFDRCRSMGRPMPIPLACLVVMEVCEALDYAHRELRLVHRDVSPQNILCSFDGEVKLTDFGIAKAKGAAHRQQAGALQGKLSHMSPEQVRGLPADHRSDIFALGIVLHELLTGERLFFGNSDLHTLELIRLHKVSPPRQLNPRISPGLERVVLTALADANEDRYPRAKAFASAIEGELTAMGELCSRHDLAQWMSSTFSR